jgi:transcriptional regulator GlxA family with amidase domain
MKQVTIVVPNGYADLTSIMGSLEVLNRANERWEKIGNASAMTIHIAGFVRDRQVDAGFFSVRPEDISAIKQSDLVIIPSVGHYYHTIAKENRELVRWLREQYKNGAEIASICTGAFLLAATGLLDGKTCSTHWVAATDFKRLYPNILLQTDKLICEEKGIYTNGGAYSFLNLLLFLIEKYFDRQTAVVCAKMYQIDFSRTSQSPFHIFEGQKDHGDELIGKAQTYIEENLSGKISFEELASKLAVSRRNFDRRFLKATGNTPVEYLQRAKVEVAKNALEQGRKTVFEVMYDVGYSDDKAFRVVFKKITGLSPLAYRSKFMGESAGSQDTGARAQRVR